MLKMHGNNKNFHNWPAKTILEYQKISRKKIKVSKKIKQIEKNWIKNWEKKRKFFEGLFSF